MKIPENVLFYCLNLIYIYCYIYEKKKKKNVYIEGPMNNLNRTSYF